MNQIVNREQKKRIAEAVSKNNLSKKTKDLSDLFLE
jgi:hypothetical protein